MIHMMQKSSYQTVPKRFACALFLTNTFTKINKTLVNAACLRTVKFALCHALLLLRCKVRNRIKLTLLDPSKSLECEALIYRQQKYLPTTVEQDINS